MQIHVIQVLRAMSAMSKNMQNAVAECPDGKLNLWAYSTPSMVRNIPCSKKPAGRGQSNTPLLSHCTTMPIESAETPKPNAHENRTNSSICTTMMGMMPLAVSVK